VSGVRTPTPAYNNALPYQLSYAHGTQSANFILIKDYNLILNYGYLILILIYNKFVKEKQMTILKNYDGSAELNLLLFFLMFVFNRYCNKL